MTIRPKARAGFTLIEILIASAIFAFSVIILIQSRSVSLRSSVESEDLFKATQLAQSLIVDKEVKYQSYIDKNGIKEGVIAEESGVFPAPFESFKWTTKLQESPVKLGTAELKELLTSFGVDPSEAESQLEQQKLLLANINKLFKENYVELAINVTWDRFNRTYSFPIVTHLIPTKPKVNLSATVDE